MRPACLPTRCPRFADGAGGNLGPAPKHLCDSVPCDGSRPLCGHERCRLVLSQVLAAGEGSTSKVAAPWASPNLPAALASFSPSPRREQGGAAGTPRASTLHARGWARTLQLHVGIGVIGCAHGSHNGIACPWRRGVLGRRRQQHSTLVGQLKAAL